ncbi:hypothetical protein ABZW10_33100 [Kitasatospora sp. NPDC004723]|uniref:hypothetical protein n=1 Tax=Kitasatospora sp. NPDC004723 TaxID=3154288 RepID=UPI0033AC8795
MDQFANSAQASAAAWSGLAAPDAETSLRLRYPTREPAAELVPCGREWDAVVLPLDRGLTALDSLGLAPGDGYPVIADYTRRELVVLVPVGTGRTVEGVPDVRVLTEGAWLLVPVGDAGHCAAAWLGSPGPEGRFVDPAALRSVLVGTEQRRTPGRGSAAATAEALAST